MTSSLRILHFELSVLAFAVSPALLPSDWPLSSRKRRRELYYIDGTVPKRARSGGAAKPGGISKSGAKPNEPKSKVGNLNFSC